MTLLPVGEHELRREQVVDRQPVAAGEVAVPAAERQACHPRRGDDPAGHREPVLVRGSVDLLPQAAAADADSSRLGIDRDRLQQRQVTDDSGVDAAETTAVVAAAVDRERQLVCPCERDRRRDLVGARAPHDHRGALVDHRVEQGSCPVVARVLRADQLAAERVAQLGAGGLRGGHGRAHIDLLGFDVHGNVGRSSLAVMTRADRLFFPRRGAT